MLTNVTLLSWVLPARADSESQANASCSFCNLPSEFVETSHLVRVNIVDEEIFLQIEPLIFPQEGCGSCSDACGGTHGISNVRFTVLEQKENHTVTLITYEFRNGTTVESTITQTLLWSHYGLTEGINRTAKLISTEVTVGGSTRRSYRFSYSASSAEYNFTLGTNLLPFNSEVYANSLTVIEYVPAQHAEVTSFEFVEINSSVTLSQSYAILSKVAKELGKLYERNGNETITQLAQNYFNIEREVKGLSHTVGLQLEQYNHQILRSSAVIRDMLCVDCGGPGGPPPPPPSECTLDCWLSHLGSCGINIPLDATGCIWDCFWFSLLCFLLGPEGYVICLGACFTVCQIYVSAEIILCAIEAMLQCCTTL